jgi:phospholipid/cholesterol/gamma-HCH transport system substrate-binding protein
MSRTIKVGVFLVGGIVLFCVGLFLIGTHSQIFTHHFTVYTEFNNIDTLQTGAKVRVSGMDAGEITGIKVPSGPSSRFRLQLKIDEKFRPIVRQDSTASIETEGMVGNKFVNIDKGSQNSLACSRGCTLPSQEPVSMDALMHAGSDLAKTLQSTIQDVQRRADGALQNITDAVGHADGLITAVKPNAVKIAANAAGITRNVGVIAAGIRQGQGTAGKLLTDKTVASNVETTIANARQTTANLKQASGKVNIVAENAESMTRQLNQAVGTFLSTGNHNENTAAALRDAAHGAKRATANLSDDTEAIKHNFFFRGFFNRRGFYSMDTMTPSKYADTRFVKKPRVRVWVPAAGLFKVAPDGSQELTDVGKSILDQSMSDLTPYLPNNPIVVEGYSATGMPDQRYRASRQRAIEVRQYLDSRFHLDPKRVGIMPLSDHPLTEKKVWDGVSLVLVVSKK